MPWCLDHESENAGCATGIQDTPCAACSDIRYFDMFRNDGVFAWGYLDTVNGLDGSWCDNLFFVWKKK
jgi:hypothetical protein